MGHRDAGDGPLEGDPSRSARSSQSRHSPAGGSSRSTWGSEPIAVAARLGDSRSRQGGEDGALRDLYGRCDGGEHRLAARCKRPCKEATRLEATASAPGPGSPAQAINGPRSAESSATPTPFAASALAVGGGRARLDDESRAWLESLATDPRGEALVRLRALLLRATQFEVARRRGQLLHVDDRELQKLAHTAADTALTRIIDDLDHYRGASRFTTWAAKFALLEAATRLRKLGWHDGHPPSWRQAREGLSPTLQVALSDMTEALTADQCYVFEALTVDGVPIDVLAEDMGTTRGDVYQTLQSARAMLRARLAQADSV